MKAVVDCNSFYCSCERVFRPELANRPVVVLSNNDGCIISRTDEARELGVAMAAPYYQNRDIIRNNGIAVFSSNYNLYGDMSRRVMETLRDTVSPDKVEVYSVDEAFLDLDLAPTEQLVSLAASIRETVEQWTGIKVSVGVAPTKVLSKLANHLAKKDKVHTDCVLVLDTEEKIRRALEATPVEDVWGVGRRYATRLKELWQIGTADQLAGMSEEWARKNMGGVVGARLIRELRGEPCIGMKDPLETKKMIATTRMFGKPVEKIEHLKEAVATYTARAAEKLRRQRSAAGLVQVFVVMNAYEGKYRYNPETKTHHVVLPKPTNLTNELISYATPLVERLYRRGPRYLKAGVMLGDIVPDDALQGNLFIPHRELRQQDLMYAMDNINFSMRNDVLKFATGGTQRNWKMRQDLRSKRYTTRWEELYEVH